MHTNKPDLADISRSVLRLRAEVPEDAFTTAVLGSQRTGNGIVINDDGLTLTIGYLITEAKDVWLTAVGGREVAGHALAYDHVTGFGLVLPLEKPDVPPIPLGSSSQLLAGDEAFVLSYPEFAKPHTVSVVGRREFAGAWEYLLEGAIFAAPAHPHWSGAALVDSGGTLVGLGSLLVREVIGGEDLNANMFVPIDLLIPILHDLRTKGQAARRSRPWLGIYSVEAADKVYVTAVADGGPGQIADVHEGDMIIQVGEHEISGLSDFYRHVWAMGSAGVAIPLTLIRGGTLLRVAVRSIDRNDLLKRPQAH
ncbi:MAG: S1C family serine protease [Pseudomonadota bacterium]|nr:S1C family serine protease [Pseudomonadota bacterium]